MVKKRNECEHELFFSEEEIISDEERIVVLKCSLCNAKFKGKVKLI